jgi:DNA-binding PadR family transcriptional regulator
MTELTFHVLLALGDSAAHGYAIGKDVQERSGGRLDPTTGALYQVLKRLTDEGLIRPTAPPAGESVDARRKYFSLTPAGREAAAAEIERLEGLVATGRQRHLHRARPR